MISRSLTRAPLFGPAAPFAAEQGRQPGASTSPDGLRELADSIAKVGLIQPILVERLADGSLRVVAGERRLRACRLVATEDPTNPHLLESGVSSIPALVADSPLTEEERREWQFGENQGRVDLSPSELALALAYERCALLLERLGAAGVAVATASLPADPTARWKALSKAAKGAGALSLPTWDDVTARLGVSFGGARAQQLVRALSKLPPALAADLDTTDVTTNGRQQLAKLVGAGRAEAAQGIWDEVRSAGDTTLLSGAIREAMADTTLTPAEAVAVAVAARTSANDARSAALRHRDASTTDPESVVDLQPLLTELRAVAAAVMSGGSLDPFGLGSVKMIVDTLS